MALSIFDDRTKQPDEDDVAGVLGEVFGHWKALQHHIHENYQPLEISWGFASKSTGWGMRLKQKKRTVLYMTPCDGYYLASFALGEKTVQAARESDLSAAVLQVIEEAPKYAEGRGARIEVRTADDVEQVEKLAAIKMSH